MKNLEKFIISKGGKELGILWDDIQQAILTPMEFRDFEKYMSGQTMCAMSGMSIVFTEDLVRFLKKLPVID